jgi:hypothetical protein
MDAKPKSNKQKRLEMKRKRERQAALAAQPDPRAQAAERAASADLALKQAKERRRDLPRFLERLAGDTSRGSAINPQIRQLSVLFSTVNRREAGRYPLQPDATAFRRLIEVCWERTDLLRGPETWRFAHALLALSAHVPFWLRQPGPWTPRSHNGFRQFDSLLRHLLARYDVPAFMNTAWLEGLTPEGVVHQRWFIHVAQGGNLRTAPELPIPLTKRQAHLYLQAPAEFDVLSAFRWAQACDLGAEWLARSIAGTRIGRAFEHDDFWVTVLRWLAERPMLDPAQVGPIVDYLHDQRFVASAPNPLAHLLGQPLLVPPQPNLTMKGRNPETLLAAVAAWHRRLGRFAVGHAVHWAASTIKPFQHEEGEGSSRKIYTICELTSSHDLIQEGRAMRHCVASYVSSCRGGRVSIWSLRVVDGTGQEVRLLTLEVDNRNGQIVQARSRFNQFPSRRELSLLHRWTTAGGPAISKWVTQ